MNDARQRAMPVDEGENLVLEANLVLGTGHPEPVLFYS
jgi:hypothetical protein